jgi:cytochrome c553
MTGRRSGVAAAAMVAALGAAFGAAFGSSAVSAQIGGRPTRPHVTPPKGPPRQVIFKYCTSCHGIDDYAYYSQDRAAWDALLGAKHRGLDVPLPAAERAILLDWLAERFGPTVKPFPRTYVAQEVTTFYSDDEAEALLQRACTSCHEPDRYNNARFPPDRWRVVIVEMRERGAELADEELERLVEWLGRTKGSNQ